MLYGCINGKGVASCLLVILASNFLIACENTLYSDMSREKTSQGGVSISGTVSIAPGSSADSDVNDPNSSYRSNDSIDNAQTIPNPTTLGGYVNHAGSGNEGRSFQQGDTDDYFLVQLFSGQSITINITDFNLASSPPNRIALFLLDQSGSVLQHTTGDQQMEIINVNADGLYYLRVLALTGLVMF